MKRKLTESDVVFTLEMISDGVQFSFIARYVFGITSVTLKSRLKSWDAL